MNRGEMIEEVQTFTIAGLSLRRPISVDDIKWAVEEGFKAGEKFEKGSFNSENKNGGKKEWEE